MSILYFPNNVSIVVTIWKWMLAQSTVDGYSLRQLLVTYNECNIPTIDEEGEIGVEAIYFSKKEAKCWTF
jgi:hypothetical protein